MSVRVGERERCRLCYTYLAGRERSCPHSSSSFQLFHPIQRRKFPQDRLHLTSTTTTTTTTTTTNRPVSLAHLIRRYLRADISSQGSPSNSICGQCSVTLLDIEQCAKYLRKSIGKLKVKLNKSNQLFTSSLAVKYQKKSVRRQVESDFDVDVDEEDEEEEEEEEEEFDDEEVWRSLTVSCGFVIQGQCSFRSPRTPMMNKDVSKHRNHLQIHRWTMSNRTVCRAMMMKMTRRTTTRKRRRKWTEREHRREIRRTIQRRNNSTKIIRPWCNCGSFRWWPISLPAARTIRSRTKRWWTPSLTCNEIWWRSSPIRWTPFNRVRRARAISLRSPRSSRKTNKAHAKENPRPKNASSPAFHPRTTTTAMWVSFVCEVDFLKLFFSLDFAGRRTRIDFVFGLSAGIDTESSSFVVNGRPKSQRKSSWH